MKFALRRTDRLPSERRNPHGFCPFDMQDRIATKFTNNAARNLISSVPNAKYNNVPHRQDKLNMKIPRHESCSLSGDACATARVTPFRNCAKMAASLYIHKWSHEESTPAVGTSNMYCQKCAKQHKQLPHTNADQATAPLKCFCTKVG